jgi:hypothetical protein
MTREEAVRPEEGLDLPPGMCVYYLVLLRRGPVWTPEETPELERLQEAHLANIHHVRRTDTSSGKVAGRSG